ncbi:hypothetical protein RR48_12034 [Papilio machaon]|uniref:Uncharacterized protein n=1 Tax=Papilio machaon TaxID=76193 RepID=A0A194RQ86_PAPMA|nr:hypothetical protein RR48_12034 [Papilio machaon]
MASKINREHLYPLGTGPYTTHASKCGSRTFSASLTQVAPISGFYISQRGKHCADTDRGSFVSSRRGGHWRPAACRGSGEGGRALQRSVRDYALARSPEGRSSTVSLPASLPKSPIAIVPRLKASLQIFAISMHSTTLG